MHDVTRSASRQRWAPSVPPLAPHILRTTPWVTVIVGCASGTAILALLAHFADHAAISQGTVRVTFLPAVAAVAFVPHVQFRPVTQTTPIPTWITAGGQILLAAPVLAVTTWAQLRLMANTQTAGSVGHPPATYPLVAQLTAWCLLTLAIAAGAERTRYAALSGAIAIPISFTIIAVTTYSHTFARYLLAPPADVHIAAIACYATAAAATAVTCLAIGDHWRRYTGRLQGLSQLTRRKPRSDR
jgi:hypothetical protein